MMETLLEGKDIVLEYAEGRRRVRALDHVSLSVARGEFVGLVGPSGSGKSSLLFVLAGLRAPTSGQVTVLGQPLSRRPEASAGLRRRHVGFLFQEPFLVPYLTVRENALGHAPGEAAARRVAQLAADIGIAPLLDERPHLLSGGERQRVGLLRALAAAPAIVLADEPTASLDAAAGHEVMAALCRHGRESGILVVTHDLRMLANADRVVALADGRLVEA